MRKHAFMALGSVLLALLLGAAGWAGALAVSEAAPRDDALYVLFTYQELQLKGDVDGALAMFTDDAVMSGRGLCTPNPCVGKAAIRPEIVRAAGTRATVVQQGWDGDKLLFRSELRSDQIRSFGVERVRADHVVEFRDGKISAFRFTWDMSDPQTTTLLKLVAERQAAAQASVGAPRTGDGGLADAEDAALPAWSLAVAAVSALALGLRVLTRIRG